MMWKEVHVFSLKKKKNQRDFKWMNNYYIAIQQMKFITFGGT